MKRRKCSIFSMVLLMTLIVGSLPAYVGASDEKKIPKLGPVKLNAHPTSLEGKTVLLRWNGKYNGDKFLIRVGELLTQQVKNVKILKMWEKDPGTAVMSKSEEVSKQITAKIERLKPDIIIAAQAD